MDFDYDWLTLGRRRVRLRSSRGFPTEGMRLTVRGMRLAIENNMSARARLVDVAVREEKSYELSIGTTFTDDRLCMPQVQSAIAVVLGLLPGQVRIFVTVATQEEVDLHFGVYERMLARKIGGLPPIGRGQPSPAAGASDTRPSPLARPPAIALADRSRRLRTGSRGRVHAAFRHTPAVEE